MSASINSLHTRSSALPELVLCVCLCVLWVDVDLLLRHYYHLFLTPSTTSPNSPHHPSAHSARLFVSSPPSILLRRPGPGVTECVGCPASLFLQRSSPHTTDPSEPYHCRQHCLGGTLVALHCGILAAGRKQTVESTSTSTSTSTPPAAAQSSARLAAPPPPPPIRRHDTTSLRPASPLPSAVFLRPTCCP